MKIRNILLALFAACFSHSAPAQSADETIAELLNSGNWFALEKVFPELEDSIRTPYLRCMTKALLDYTFNRPEQALAGFDTLMSRHQMDMTFSNISNLILYRSKLMQSEKNYETAADYLDNFLRYVSCTMDTCLFPLHLQQSRMLNRLRGTEIPKVIRPDHDTELPLSIQPVIIQGIEKGALMFIPVTFRSKTFQFILDTGAEKTMFSQRLADELGLRTICDSIRIEGLGSRLGSLAIADSLCIGNIVYKNPMVAVLPPNPAVDTLLYIDAILGCDFLIAVGEVQIYPKKKKIVFPTTPTPSPLPEKNLVLMNGGGPYLEAWTGDERLLMLFDTGNSTGGMYPSYYQKHKKRIEAKSTPDTVLVGGMDLYTATVYRLPGFPLRTGGSEIGIDNMIVETAENGPSHMEQSGDGALGMDFIRQFRKVTINFDQMYVSAEK